MTVKIPDQVALIFVLIKNFEEVQLSQKSPQNTLLWHSHILDNSSTWAGLPKVRPLLRRVDVHRPNTGIIYMS
jgi:hypothetical protein